MNGSSADATEQSAKPWWNDAPTAILLLVTLAGALAFAVVVPVTNTEAPGIGLSTAIILVAIGLLAGLLGGLIGTGGCSVMLPAIHFWMGFSAPVAIGTTLFAVIFTAISGGYAHLVHRNLDVRPAVWLGGAGILGVVFGSWLFTRLTDRTEVLGLILGIAFVLPAVRMISEGIFGKVGSHKVGNVIPGSPYGWGSFGLLIGILTGVVGLGGGYALVPGLIYLFGAPVYVTMGTSLAVMIPLAVVGGGMKLVQGFVALQAGFLMASGTIVGARYGASIIKRFKPSTLKLIFGLYFFYVSVKFIAGYFGIAVW